MLERVIFGHDEYRAYAALGVQTPIIHLQHQGSYFEDRNGLDGLLKCVDDKENDCQLLERLWEDRNDDNIAYTPFSHGLDVSDTAFRDVIQGMMT